MERIFITVIKSARNSVIYTSMRSQCSKIGAFCYTRNTSSVLSNLSIEHHFNIGLTNYNSSRQFHTNGPNFRFDERERDMKRALKAHKDEGTEGEKALSVDNAIRGFGKLFPDEDTPNKIFDGVRFSDLPVVYIKVSKNNTYLTVSDAKGKLQFTRSCGTEGFKNARKGTNVAAQATAQSVGLKALDRGIKTVRVAIKGLGAGRIASVKGLVLGGLNVVSISDVTPISFNIYPRPRKARRL